MGPRETLGLQLSHASPPLRQFQASGDYGAPAVGYCLFFLSVNFGPQGILGFRLSEEAWSRKPEEEKGGRIRFFEAI